MLRPLKTEIFLCISCAYLIIQGNPAVWAANCKSQTTLKLLALLPNCNIVAGRSIAHLYPSWNQADCRQIHERLDFIVELINNSSELLPCHNLSLVIKDDGCSGRDTEADKIATSLVSGLFPQDGSKVVGILGPACSESVRKVVYVASKPEIELVVLHNAYGGSESIFKQSKNSLGILGTTRALFNLSLALIKKSGWENICILYEGSHHFYRNMKDEFLGELATNTSVKVAITLPVSSDSVYPFDELRSSGVRIVFVFATREHSRRILCQAYHMGLVYPAYQWVILSHTLSDFTRSENPTVGHSEELEYKCSHNNILLALEKSYLVSFLTETTASKIYLQTNTFPHHNISYFTPTHLHWVYSLFDALWCWAFVLHNVSTMSDSLLDDASSVYGDALTANAILQSFYNLSFEGKSGPIGFSTSSGFTNRPVNLHQIRNGNSTLIGTSNDSALNIELPLLSISDHVAIIKVLDEGYVIFFFALACVELVIAILLHLMTFIYRQAKSVKGTSPKLIHLAFVGSYVFIATLFLNCISWFRHYGPQIDAAFCQAMWAWGMPISFTLTMGIVTVRTWRLYRIFVHYMDPGKFLSNPALTAAVLMMVSVDIVIAVVWTSTDPVGFRYLEVTVKDGSEYKIVLEPRCHINDLNFVWFILIFMYKIGLLLTLNVLTLLTRTIPNGQFSVNATRGFTYSFTTVFVVGFAVYYAFLFSGQEQQSLFIILAFILNTMYVLFVAFIIIPPLLPIFCKKRKNT